MSQAADILIELQGRGISLRVEGDTLCLGPKRALDGALLARVREAKPAILETLRKFPSTCSPECYEVTPGVWIHRPHAGCATTRPEAKMLKRRQVQVMCWHCRGDKRCGCVVCWQGGLGRCVPCKGTGQVWQWMQ